MVLDGIKEATKSWWNKVQKEFNFEVLELRKKAGIRLVLFEWFLSLFFVFCWLNDDICFYNSIEKEEKHDLALGHGTCNFVVRKRSTYLRLYYAHPSLNHQMILHHYTEII